YWNVFNEEGESAASAVIVTYETLADMLADTNRAGFGVPDSVGFGQNVVGSGSEVSRVEFQVSKDFTDDNSSEVTVSLECSSGLVSEPVQVSEGNPQTLSVLAFDSGEYGTTGCTVTESNMPEGYYQMSASEGCEVADLTPGAQYDCEFVNAPNLASFKVSKDFSDNNAAEVEVTLTCNSGQPLEQSFMISEGKPVNFVVTDFQNGEMDCTVSETVAAEGYTPSYYNGSESSNTDCSYTDVVSGEHLCEISNAANPATYTVTKEWLIEGSGADGIDLTADVHVNCDSPILDVEGGTQALLKLVPVTLDAWVTLKGESDAATLTVDTTDGTARCSAVEDITQSGVESESDTGCSGASLPAGGSASCTITNTVFFEGIPTLNRWALGTLAVLMLGIGLTAFRRIV
ncbi:MAG: IPTL-CTERM sorting domain-containing protein, partial [Lysobacterales bacterium]